MNQNIVPKASEVRRQAVLRAASWQFAENGYKGATVESIADAAGVSKGLVFYFFKSKSELFSAVLDDGISRWVEVTEVPMAEENSDYAAVLRKIFLSAFEFVERHPILLLLMRDQGFPQKKYNRTQLARNNKRWRKRVERVLSAGMKSGQFKRTIDPKMASIIAHELQMSLIQSMYKQGKIRILEKKLVVYAANFVVDAVCR